MINKLWIPPLDSFCSWIQQYDEICGLYLFLDLNPPGSLIKRLQFCWNIQFFEKLHIVHPTMVSDSLVWISLRGVHHTAKSGSACTLCYGVWLPCVHHTAKSGSACTLCYGVWLHCVHHTAKSGSACTLCYGVWLPCVHHTPKSEILLVSFFS